MRRTKLIPIALAGALASAAACRDTPTTIDRSSAPPPAVPGVTTPSAPGAAAPTYSQPGTIGVVARELPVGGRVLLRGPLYSLVSYDEVYEGIGWTISDPLIAGTSPATGPVGTEGTSAIWLRGLTPGRAELTVDGGRLQATIPITVLATSDAPSTIVVDDFFVIEYSEGGGWRYAPQIVLRDTAVSPQSATIAVRFELPNAGASQPCAMRREVSGNPMNLFYGWGTTPELSLETSPGYRAPAGGMAVAHLTLRVPGPFAKTLTLQGRIVSGTPPTAVRPGSEIDVLSCG